jgi:hypothetical protein
VAAEPEVFDEAIEGAEEGAAPAKKRRRRRRKPAGGGAGPAEPGTAAK